MLPKIDWALANPGDWSEMSNLTVLVRRRVTPTSTPRSTKKVARVMMKLGSLVRTTSRPLAAPMMPAKISTMTIPTQTLTCCRVMSMPSSKPLVPVMTPADRSNSPPIMRSATATAMIP